MRRGEGQKNSEKEGRGEYWGGGEKNSEKRGGAEK